jgi:hypothetical protein
MLKQSVGTARLEAPREADLRWVASLFETRMRFSHAGTVRTQLILQVHMKHSKDQDRLLRFFGGGSYYLPSSESFRWRITEKYLLDFVEQIKPFLGRVGLDRAEALRAILALRGQKQPTADARVLLASLLGHLK